MANQYERKFHTKFRKLTLLKTKQTQNNAHLPGTSKMTQPVEALATKSNGPSLSPRTHMVERENILTGVLLPATHACLCTLTQTHRKRVNVKRNQIKEVKRHIFLGPEKWLSSLKFNLQNSHGRRKNLLPINIHTWMRKCAIHMNTHQINNEEKRKGEKYLLISPKQGQNWLYSPPPGN